MKKHIPISLLLLLSAIFAISPFAIDSYLPAIPAMADDLNTNTSLVAITVSIYVLGLAIGQLIGGPLSDRFGRMPIIVTGLLIFAIGSLFLANTQSLEMLWGWRMLQSIGGGIAVVGVPATIRDNATGKEAARLFSLIALIMMLAPSIAPSVGTLILHTLGWRWIFIILSIVAMVVALISFVVMPNTKKAKGTKTSGGYISVFKERRALNYLIVQGFGSAVLMTFITNAPFAYIEYFKISPELFAGLFLANVIGIIIINRINSLLLHRYEPSSLLKGFLAMQLLGVLILVCAVILAPGNLWFVVTGFVISAAANGGTMSNSSACFMHYFEKNAGVAAALLGAVQYGTAAAVSALAAILTTNTLWPMILAMLLANLLALAGAFNRSRVKPDNSRNQILPVSEPELLTD